MNLPKVVKNLDTGRKKVDRIPLESLKHSRDFLQQLKANDFIMLGSNTWMFFVKRS